MDHFFDFDNGGGYARCSLAEGIYIADTAVGVSIMN